MLSKNEIQRNCKQWANDNLEEGFVFRKYQLEAITDIIHNRLNNVKTQVMEAPTGSGKSLIAIISAGVLYDYYGISSYILASDVSLFKQYREDLKRYNLDWGCVSGKDNYYCSKNGESFANGYCQNSNISVVRLFGVDKGNKESKDGKETDVFELNKNTTYSIDKYYNPSVVPKSYSLCSRTCQYLNDLKKALERPIVVMTYQLWYMHHIFMDSYKGSTYVFPNKDFVIGDEAHNLPSITQNLFSPKFDIDLIYAIRKVLIALDENGLETPDIELFENIHKMMYECTNPNSDIVFLKKYLSLLDTILKHKSSDFKIGKGNDKGQDTLPSTLYMIKQLVCCIDKYIKLFISQPLTNLVKTRNEAKQEIVYHFADEPKLVKGFFNDTCTNYVLMSATIGDLDSYQELIGLSEAKIEDFKAFEVPSTFNFSKSPIYYSNINRMSFKEKEKSLPNVVDQVIKICKYYKGQRGIIQTGSYEFSKALFTALPPDLKSRVINYTSSKEKESAVKDFMSLPNKILIGPSIFEGLNFNDDLCRFIIIMKVPYASLADPLVKAKMSLYPTWYQYDTINRIVQGVGRGIRSANDWAVTYILDGCFNDLMVKNRNLFNKTFLSRLQKI